MDKYSQILAEGIFSHNVDYSSEIVSHKHQPNIGFGSLFILFGKDVTESPLSLDGAIRVLYYGLSLSVITFVLFNTFFITVNVMLILASLNSFSVFGFGALCFNRAIHTSPCGVSFKIIGS